jgi:NhaP-type Na+/H+ and K+/H+ antiporter
MQKKMLLNFWWVINLILQKKEKYHLKRQKNIDENDLPYIETSSKEGININELFESSIKSFLSNNKYIGGDKI